MGMYTEFHFNSELKNVTDNVATILKYMIGEKNSQSSIAIPPHPFFNCDRWNTMLVGDSYYFDMVTNSQFVKDMGNYYLSVRCNLKNYDDEIQEFCNWIYPFLYKYPGDFLGFYRYEESLNPTIIKYGENEIKFEKWGKNEK